MESAGNTTLPGKPGNSSDETQSSGSHGDPVSGIDVYKLSDGKLAKYNFVNVLPEDVVLSSEPTSWPLIRRVAYFDSNKYRKHGSFFDLPLTDTRTGPDVFMRRIIDGTEYTQIWDNLFVPTVQVRRKLFVARAIGNEYPWFSPMGSRSLLDKSHYDLILIFDF